MTSQTPDKPTIKANNNPWYLLSTVYGPPGDPLADDPKDKELQVRNRAAWNRYMATELGEDRRAQIIKEVPHLAQELIPFTAEEMVALARSFFERHQRAASTASTKIPNLKQGLIDFSNVEFDEPFSAGGLCFPERVNFERATFSEYADFEGATFSGVAAFQGAAFSENANFAGATFSQMAAFLGATFSWSATFEGATFSDLAHFKNLTFSSANFKRATFSGEADFVGATFSEYADFQGATFSKRRADFKDATFSEYADFKGAIFSLAEANFTRTTFYRASFEGAIFSDLADFTGATFKGPASFEKATFSSAPPLFFGATLYEGTVWRDITWPKPPEEAGNAGPFVDAYERLKQEMDRLKKHEDELDFFALELQSRRARDGVFSGLPIALFGLLSNYGRSYVRPLAGLLVTVAVGALACWPHFGLSKFGQAVGLSLANTFAVLGFRKDFIEPQVIESLSRALKVFSAAQTVAGIVLLFLFGLAIRNHFRMK